MPAGGSQWLSHPLLVDLKALYIHGRASAWSRLHTPAFNIIAILLHTGNGLTSAKCPKCKNNPIEGQFYFGSCSVFNMMLQWWNRHILYYIILHFNNHPSKVHMQHQPNTVSVQCILQMYTVVDSHKWSRLLSNAHTHATGCTQTHIHTHTHTHRCMRAVAQSSQGLSGILWLPPAWVTWWMTWQPSTWVRTSPGSVTETHLPGIEGTVKVYAMPRAA